MKTITLFCSLTISIGTFAQLPEEKSLYPDGIEDNPITHPHKESYVDSLVHPKSLTGLNRVYSYVSEPTYMIFPANKEKNKNIGLVIFPGGGFRNVWLDKEGTDIALWMSQHGITCMVVKYRTNRRNDKGRFEIDFNRYKDAINQDACTSMLIMKSLADSLNFDRDKVGVMGFSAGGRLAQILTFRHYNDDYEWNPSFTAIIYDVGDVAQFEKIKNPENLPPFFMAVAGNDYRLNIARYIDYLARVSVTAKKSELHVYSDGGHGFGLAYDDNSSVKHWKNAFINWISNLY
jgi:acetyl esterase/lipase